MRKAKQYAEKKSEEEQLIEFNASRGWLEKFMICNGPSLRRCTTQAKKTPEKIIEKLVSYIVYIPRMKEKKQYLSQIIAMDETAVWHDMLSNTTVTNKGAKSVVLKTSGHEKSWMTLC